MTFHTFYSKTWKGGFYLDYDSEATWTDILDCVLYDPVRPKLECPAIVLNRFKTLQTEHGPTVKNKYENLEHTTGWFGLDVDGTGKLTALTKRVIFERLPGVRLVWVSSSGDGVKAIGYNERLKNLTPKEFRMQSLIMSLMYRHDCHMRINFDPAMHRCHQPIFINSDPNAFYR